MAKCSGITQVGTACKGIPIEGSQWCHAHHPDRSDDRRRHGSRGGKRGGRGRPQVEVNAVKTQLQELVDGVLAGKVERADAAVVGQLLGTYIRAVGAELKVREQLEVVERLETLEEGLRAQRGGYNREA
ncbi:MAG: hypothetical protein AVDCRST_MAG01-01-607 [uncultured Rubrobacteraceae bacterium]|uniref:Uncharacterized protein n=1 Tax=uncultured Rubrobacteraceae bacterium TaxID=349277 RepID=A0A6J4NVI4_9ACTN|nr:MAG: hypothetical protein AVDCRST_MAG01-01-607 [uncultured Rubrobacteraceae bacterium]